MREYLQRNEKREAVVTAALDALGVGARDEEGFASVSVDDQTRLAASGGGTAEIGKRSDYLRGDA